MEPEPPPGKRAAVTLSHGASAAHWRSATRLLARERVEASGRPRGCVGLPKGKNGS